MSAVSGELLASVSREVTLARSPGRLEALHHWELVLPSPTGSELLFPSLSSSRAISFRGKTPLIRAAPGTATSPCVHHWDPGELVN